MCNNTLGNLIIWGNLIIFGAFFLRMILEIKYIFFGNNIRVVPVNYLEKVSETCFSSFFVGVVKKKGVYLWKISIYSI